MTFVNELEKSRVIDYERNIYMVPANPELPHRESVDEPHTEYWNLHLGDGPRDVVWFGAFLNTNLEEKEITWTVHKIDIPEHLNPRKQEIKKLIEEGLDSYGLFYGKKNVAKQNFKIHPWLNTFN